MAITSHRQVVTLILPAQSDWGCPLVAAAWHSTLSLHFPLVLKYHLISILSATMKKQTGKEALRLGC